MKLKISYPNDYGSDAAYAAMLADLGMDAREDSAQVEREAFEAMAFAAKAAGGTFVEATDFGAEWEFSAAPDAGAFPSWCSWAVEE